MTHEDKDMSLPPKLREWNLNTLILGFGLMVMFVGWGIAWGSVRNDVEDNSDAISEIKARINEIDESNQRFANLDYRVTVEEKATGDINATLRELERSIASVVSDVRVIKEFLERDRRSFGAEP